MTMLQDLRRSKSEDACLIHVSKVRCQVQLCAISHVVIPLDQVLGAPGQKSWLKAQRVQRNSIEAA